MPGLQTCVDVHSRFADVCRRALKVCRRVLLLLDTMVAVGNELDHQVLLLDPLVTMTIA